MDLILLDLSMPILSGESFLRNLRSVDSTLPVVLSTGQSPDDLNDFDIQAVLLKPYPISQALHCIRRVIDQAAEAIVDNTSTGTPDP